MSEDNQGLSKTLIPPQISGVLKLVLLLLATFLFALSVNTFAQYRYIGAGIPATNTVSVSGEAEVIAVPDIAAFTFSVREEGETTDVVQERASERLNRALAFVREQGVEDRDIKTVGYSLSPQYRWIDCARIASPGEPCNERELVGFMVEQSVEVKVRDLDEAGAFVAGLSGIGVQQVWGPNFQIDDDDALKAQARTIAIEDAKEKAKALARELGVRLVRVVEFSEEGDYAAPYMARSMVESAYGMGGDAVMAPEMPRGENVVTSRVRIVYEIR